MQVLWHTMNERGRLSLKPPAVLMCLRSRGQKNRGDYLYHWLQEKKKEKKMSVKSSSKHTNRHRYWFSKCSGIPVSAGVAMSVVYLVRRQMDSGNKWSTRCPSRCMLCHLPSVLFLQLWDATQTSSATNNFHISLLEKSTTPPATNDNNKRIRVRIRSVHSGKVTPLLGSYQPPGLSVTINLLSANLLPFESHLR